MFVGGEIHALGLNRVHIMLIEEGEELLLNKTNTFAHSVDIIGLVHGGYSTLEVIHQRQHLFEDTLAGCLH